MAISYNQKAVNLFNNGHAQLGNNSGFTAFSFTNDESLTTGGSFLLTTNNYGGTTIGSQRIEVDTSKFYQFAVNIRTTQRSYNNRLGSGHLGFSCYDSQDRFIDLRNCGGVGNTVLSRNLNAGDEYLYIETVSTSGGWETGTLSSGNIIFRGIILYPSTHPEYNQPYKYSRIGLGDFNIGYNEIVQMPEGDWRLKISNLSNVSMTMPNIGYATPAGTPISRGVAGGTFNYALGAPDYPESWTTYMTPIFTGENRNSGIPFRFGTKYIRFLNLINYNWRLETAGNSARYAIDSIFLVQLPTNIRSIPTSFFRRPVVW
jgi:hypothetical protein